MVNANKLSSYLRKLVSSLGSGLLRIARWLGEAPEADRLSPRVRTTVMVCDQLTVADVGETAGLASAAKISEALRMPTGSYRRSSNDDEPSAGIAINFLVRHRTDRHLPTAQGREGIMDPGSFIVSTAIWVARPLRQTAKRATTSSADHQAQGGGEHR